jgi:hypothetical protein
MDIAISDEDIAASLGKLSTGARLWTEQEGVELKCARTRRTLWCVHCSRAMLLLRTQHHSGSRLRLPSTAIRSGHTTISEGAPVGDGELAIEKIFASCETAAEEAPSQCFTGRWYRILLYRSDAGAARRNVTSIFDRRRSVADGELFIRTASTCSARVHGHRFRRWVHVTIRTETIDERPRGVGALAPGGRAALRRKSAGG